MLTSCARVGEVLPLRAKQIFKPMSSIVNKLRTWASRAHSLFRSQSDVQPGASQSDPVQSDVPQPDPLLQEAVAAIAGLNAAVATLKAEMQEMKKEAQKTVGGAGLSSLLTSPTRRLRPAGWHWCCRRCGHGRSGRCGGCHRGSVMWTA